MITMFLFITPETQGPLSEGDEVAFDVYHGPKGYHAKSVKKIGSKDPMKKTEEKIPGGLSSGKKPESFDQEQLAAGIKVEMEHTTDKDIATEIAMDHLSEDPDYYKKLKAIEKSDLAKGLSPQEIESQGYKFKILKPTMNREAYAIAAYHKGKRSDTWCTLCT